MFVRATLLVMALPIALTSQTTPAPREVKNPSWHTAPAVWQVGTTPILDVGGLQANPANEFDPRMGYLRAAMLSDGGLAVIDDYRVHFFDAKGALRKIVGRRGAGPEDFNYITGICRTRGDTLLLNDSRNHRIAVLDRNGKVVRTNPLAEGETFSFDICLPDGSYIMEKPQRIEAGKPIIMGVDHVALDGKILGHFTAGPALGYDMVVGGEPVVSAGAGGILFYDRLSRGAVIFTPAGTASLSFQTDDPAVRITGADIDRSGKSGSMVPPGRAGTPATVWPAFQDGKFGADGLAWLMVFPVDYQGPLDWLAFDQGGKLIGRLAIPAPGKGQRHMQVLGFGTRSILVERLDEDGGRHITVYPLVPASK